MHKRHRGRKNANHGRLSGRVSESGLKAKAKVYGSQGEILLSSSKAILLFCHEISRRYELLNFVLYPNDQYGDDQDKKMMEEMVQSLGLRAY